MSDDFKSFGPEAAELEAKFKAKMAEIKTRYAEEMNSITGEMPDPNTFEALINFSFDVKWKNTKIKFDVPKIYSKRETIKFDIPEVKMKTDSIKFDVPSTKRERKCVAKKPVFRSWKWYSECIYLDVPVPYMKRVEIKLDIPKFNSKRVDISFDIPEIRMERVDVSFKIPHFYLREVRAEIRDKQMELQEVAKRMEAEMNRESEQFKVQIEKIISASIGEQFDDMREKLIEQRNNIQVPFDDAVASGKSAANALRANGATDHLARIEGEISKIVENYKGTMETIDASLNEITAQEEGSGIKVEIEEAA